MPIQKAKNYYTGQNGYQRLNCAQAVASAFKECCDVSEDSVNQARFCGGGNAPGGLCGAYYAAKNILQSNFPGNESDFEEFFIEVAGSLTCRDIRSSKRLSCVGCIEKSAEFVTKFI